MPVVDTIIVHNAHSRELAKGFFKKNLEITNEYFSPTRLEKIATFSPPSILPSLSFELDPRLTAERKQIKKKKKKG